MFFIVRQTQYHAVCLLCYNNEENVESNSLLVERIGTTEKNADLSESQIRSLTIQINLVNRLLLTSTAPLELQHIPLVLHLDQLIELCYQQSINMDKFLDNEANLRNSLLLDESEIKFALSSLQIKHLIDQNKFDMKKLITIEQNLNRQNMQAQSFRLNSSQLVYFFVNRRIANSRQVVGLSVSQLIGLYMLQQQPAKNHQSSLFSLDYQQIKQLAVIQSMSSLRAPLLIQLDVFVKNTLDMTLEHFYSLPSSNRPFGFTRNQLIYLTGENNTPIQQILSIHNDQTLKILDRKQICTLVSQSCQSRTIMENFIHHAQSIDESFHKQQQYVYLKVEQIFSLTKFSNIKLNHLRTCTTENSNVNKAVKESLLLNHVFIYRLYDFVSNQNN